MSQAMSSGTQTSQRNSQIRQSFEGGGTSPNDLVHHLKMFAEENPTSAAIWCFAIGFVVGWKLKPW
jgi:hypothetical protein